MVFVADNSALYVWGDNEFGALGLGDHIHRHTPVKLTLPTTESDIISVGCGEQHTVCTPTVGILLGLHIFLVVVRERQKNCFST
jgi:alpha-tubulin suppressor-like RCC1 family protein